MKLPLRDKKFVFLLISVALVIGLEILSLLHIKIPMPYEPFVFAVFVLGIGYKVLWEGVEALFSLRFSSINLLMLVAVAAAFYLGEYPEAAVVIVLYVLGETLEDIGVDQSRSALEELVSKSPKSAVLKGREVPVPIEEIEPGSVICVKPYDQIPMDGIIEMGQTAVDESTITGEPIPAEKAGGDPVFAGTMNKQGYIEVRTTKAAADSTLSKIIGLTFEAQENRSESQKFIQKFAKIYTPSVLALAVLVFLIPVLFGRDLNHALEQAITLLVIACPCALVISTPVAIYAAMGNASSRGILIKGGKYLETIAGVKALCLDKTRTITYGKPVVSDVFPVQGVSREELLSCTAGTELFSEHPLAAAIVEASKKEGWEPHLSEKFESIAGKGAKGMCRICSHGPVLAGNLDFIDEHSPVSGEVRAMVAQLSAEGKTSVVVSFGDLVAGVIGLTDEIKPDSRTAIQDLKDLDIVPVMLTGDHEQSARYVAAQVGISEVYGGMLPEGKAEQIKAMRLKYGVVGMVGDGINDAPALALAHVGIAMGAAGSDTAIETADIALMNDRLSLIPFVVRLGRTTVKTIRYNSIGAILVKIVFMLLAFLGMGNIVMAIVADVGVTIVVIIISLRLMKWKEAEGRKAERG